MKVGVVGSGLVGATAAYALVMRGVGREIVLVDKNDARAAAEADDFRHAVPFAHPLEVRAGSYADLAGCRVVVLCAGVGQKPGETRLQLLQRNAAVFRDVVPAVLKHAPGRGHGRRDQPRGRDDSPGGPVRRPTSACPPAACSAPAPLWTRPASARCIGTHCGVDSHHVHGYVIGEHGDSEVLTWSLVSIGGMPLEAFARLRGVDLSDAVRRDIDEKVRRAAYTIIAGKGATYYGIGCALARIVDAVLHDQRVDPDRLRPGGRRRRCEGCHGRPAPARRRGSG